MNFDAKIWGPHFWFFLMTIAVNYPPSPTETQKKIYYDLMFNFPLFLPDKKAGEYMLQLLNVFPITPYLKDQESFLKWVIFVHNQYNEQLGKPILSREQALKEYYGHYRVEQDNQFLYKFLFISVLIVIGLILALKM